MSETRDIISFGTDMTSKVRSTLLQESVKHRLDLLKTKRTGLLRNQVIIGKTFLVSLAISAVATVSGYLLEPSLAVPFSEQTWYGYDVYSNTITLPWLGIILAISFLYAIYSGYKKLQTPKLITGLFGFILLAIAESVQYTPIGEHTAPMLETVESVFVYHKPSSYALPESVIKGEMDAVRYQYKDHNKNIERSISAAENAASHLKTENGTVSLPNSWFYKMDMAAYGKPVHTQALEYVQKVQDWKSVFLIGQSVDQCLLFLMAVGYLFYGYGTDMQKRNIRRTEDVLRLNSSVADE